MPASEPLLKKGVDSSHRVLPGLEGLEKIAWLMDRSIPIPGTQMKVGLDAILGLLPVGGDFLTGLIQVGIVLVAMSHYRVPKAIAARMAANVLLDIGIGSIPLVGDLFDAFFKANTKNLQLLTRVQEQRHQNQKVSTGSSVWFLIAVGTLLLGSLALVLIGFVTVIAWLLKRPLV